MAKLYVVQDEKKMSKIFFHKVYIIFYFKYLKMKYAFKVLTNQ